MADSKPVAVPTIDSADPKAAPPQTPPTTPAPNAVAQPDPKVSSRFAALSRKERAIVQRQSEVQAKEAELAKREAALKAFEDKWQADPYKAAEEKGLKYAEWTNRILSDGKPSTESAIGDVRAEVERLRQERTEEKRAAEQAALDAQKRANEEIVAQFRTSVTDYAKAKAEEFELINVNDASNLVIATIEKHFEDTQQILDTHKACELVEKFLEEQVEKATKTKKFLAKASPQPKEEPKSAQGAGSQPKTLTNNMTATAPGFLPAKNEADRIKRAMAALERTK